MNKQELLRAQELAQAGQNANELFWMLMVGAVIIFAFWTLVRWRLNVVQCRHYRDMALRAEVEQNEHEAARYWDDFCKRNELPESTRRVLCAMNSTQSYAAQTPSQVFAINGIEEPRA